MQKNILLFGIVLLFASCDKVKETTKETINKSGEVVGKASTEFIEGVSEGVERTLDCSIVVSENLQKKGIATGKFSINNSTEGENNLLSLYIIFNQDFKGDIWVKIFDKKGLEAGRTHLLISAKANEAKYFDFNFDKRTQIETKSQISLE